MAFYLMDVYQKTMYTSMFMQEADGKKIEENLNSWFLEFIKLCGFKSKWEILEELLKKIKIKLPPAPEPEPEWFKEPLNISEKIILASLFMTNPGHEFLQNTGKEILTENVR